MMDPAIVAALPLPPFNPDDIDAIRECLRSKGTEWGSSRWAEYRRCQRAHRLRYVDGISKRRLPIVDPDLLLEEKDGSDPSKPDGRRVGSLIHAAFQWLAEGILQGKARDWRHPLAVAASDDWPLVDIFEAERVLVAYFKFWGNEGNLGFSEGFTILKAEAAFEISIGGLPLTGRADLLLADPNGRIVIVDHKSMARARSGDPDRLLRTSDQFLALARLVQVTYELPYIPEIIVNDLIKTKVPKFERQLVAITPNDLKQWVANQDETARTGMTGSLRNYNACAPTTPGSRVCDLFNYCHGSDEQREKGYEKKDSQRHSEEGS